MAETWLKCSACKNPIPYNATHWVCSVSTCNRQRTRLVFCSVSCWDSHVVVLRHRDAWAVEAHAPSRIEWEARGDDGDEAGEAGGPSPPPMRRRVDSPAASASEATGAGEGDVLIVMSKMKKYIKEKSGMNCSDGVAAGLSDHVRAVCDEAVRNAAADGRKTVLDRDIPRVRRP